jgi:hypothetical protein
LPTRLLGALPKRSRLKRLRKRALDVLVLLWHHAESMSPATRSRWQWTWVGDDSVFRKYGQDLALAGNWYSGQHKRVVSGLDGVLMLVVIGDGNLVVPVDFAVRRSDSKGPRARCRNKLEWAQVMLDQSQGALARRSVPMPAPIAVADSGFSDSKLMPHVRQTPQGILLVQGKSPYAFTMAGGQKGKVPDLITGAWWS